MQENQEPRGMAPPPAVLNRQRVERQRAEALKEQEGTLVSTAPKLQSDVMNMLRGSHWEYQKRVLDLVEAVVETDRQWAIVRRVLMDIMTEQVERQAAMIRQRIVQELKDQNDGRGTEYYGGSAAAFIAESGASDDRGIDGSVSSDASTSGGNS
jgi:hypothetical protein